MCGAPKCRKRAAELAAKKQSESFAFSALDVKIAKAPQPVGRPRKLRVVSFGKRK